jgi:hypothetical protein
VTARLLALIILMAGTGTAAGAEFGRLFFTPAQRAALDGFRKQNIQSAAVIEDDRDKDLVAPPPPPGPEHMSVGGVVRRSDGRNTAWINNRAVDAGRPGGVKLAPGKNDNRVKLTAPQSGRSFDLKVGQSVDVTSGTIEDGYARRAVPKPAPEPEPADKSLATGATTPKPQAATPPPRRAPDLQEPVGPGRPAQIEQGRPK